MMMMRQQAVTQLGNRNQSDVNQLSGRRNTATVLQDAEANDNSASITQVGTATGSPNNNEAFIFQEGTNGNPAERNSATIDQEGEEQLASISQTGSDNRGNVDQQGTVGADGNPHNNRATIQQDGDAGQSDTFQDGKLNVTSVTQEDTAVRSINNNTQLGWDNDLTLTQKGGNDNTNSFLQDNTANMAFTGNEATVTQDGSANSVLGQQIGSNNDAFVDQVGTTNAAFVFQGFGGGSAIEDNSTTINQVGNGNVSTTLQAGSDAGLVPSFFGVNQPTYFSANSLTTNSTALKTQNGDDNRAGSLQAGDNNFISQTQMGLTNSNVVIQDGNNNEVIDLQDGNANISYTQQTGDGHMSTTTQIGTGNNVQVIQN